MAVYIDEARLRVAGASFVGLVFTDFAMPSTAFAENFKRYFHTDTVEPPAAISYDIVMQYVKWIKLSGSFNVEAISDGIRKAVVSGASGAFSFDENRKTIRKPILLTVKNGRFEVLD